MQFLLQCAMPNDLTDSVTMKASKGRWLKGSSIGLVFLVIVLSVRFPPTPFFLVFRILMIPLCLFAVTVCVTAFITDKYDLRLNPQGIEFGSFYGKRRYKWSEIKATGVIRPVTGERVFIELTQPTSSGNGGRLPIRYLPDNYGMKAEELAKMLLRWQREYGRVEGP
jgi:hypothetical protein